MADTPIQERAPSERSISFPQADGFPRLRILDSTDPAQVLALDRALDLRSTLFFVSSKSGSTLEPSIFRDYFLARVQEELGAEAVRASNHALVREGRERVARALGVTLPAASLTAIRAPRPVRCEAGGSRTAP